MKAKREFRLECDPAQAFLHEHCAADPKATTLATTLYFEYECFCKVHGYKPFNDANFGKEVRRSFPRLDG